MEFGKCEEHTISVRSNFSIVGALQCYENDLMIRIRGSAKLKAHLAGLQTPENGKVRDYWKWGQAND